MGENLHSITEQLFDLNKVAYHRLDVLEFAKKKEKEGRDNALPVLPKE